MPLIDDPNVGSPVDAVVDQGSSAAALQRILRSARRHVGLEIAFVAEILGTDRVFRFVDHDLADVSLAAGERQQLDQSYCHYVLSGELPAFLPDPASHPVASELGLTTPVPVGTHLSVPIRFSDGRLYGTFCCFSRHVEQDLDPDVRVIQMLAEVTADLLEELERSENQRRHREQVIRAVITDPTSLTIHLQPIIDLQTMQLAGLEALSRFRDYPNGPAALFSEAEELGLGFELEMRAARDALALLPQIPHPLRLNINVSPSTLVHQEFYEAVAGVGPDRLVVEVTEHAAVEDYVELRRASLQLRGLGIWLAIDDVGMGFAGLQHILENEPDELKLDRVVIQNVDTEPVREALVEALCTFGDRSGFNVLAEGVETHAELEAVRRLGARFAQGFFIGKPAPLAKALSQRDFESLLT